MCTGVGPRARICLATVVSALAALCVATGTPSGAVAAPSSERTISTAIAYPTVGSTSQVSPTATTPTINAVPILSSYESANRSISRDIGISVVLPDGHELWLFGDTSIYERVGDGWGGLVFIDGSTALEANFKRGHVPHGGEYPTGKPSRFIAVPKDVYLTDGSGQPCIRGFGDAAFAARWPTGVAVMPSNKNDLLITYSVVCVTGGGATAQDRPEGWGYMLYNWKTHTVDHGPIDVVVPQTTGAAIPSSSLFGWPIIDGRNVTLFSSNCSDQFLSCGNGQVSSVTMPAAISVLDNPSSYTPRNASTDGSAAWQPLSISVGRYPTGLRLIELTSIVGTYKVFSAASVAGPWHLKTSGTLPNCKTKTGFCFALEGHPELSTATKLFVSYVDPNAGPGLGHEVMSAIPD